MSKELIWVCRKHLVEMKILGFFCHKGYCSKCGLSSTVPADQAFKFEDGTIILASGAEVIEYLNAISETRLSAEGSKDMLFVT